MTRDADIAAMYKCGSTTREIAVEVALSEEHVWLLLNRSGLTGRHGGRVIRLAMKQAEKHNRLVDWCQEHMGCAFDQWMEMRRHCNELKAAGVSRCVTPLGAYSFQKNNAKRRGITFEIKFWDWWTVWQESGHWHERGRGLGYVMCRHGDVGPYALGNVYIGGGSENSSLAGKKPENADLPLGAYPTVSGKFSSHRVIGGQRFYLGVFDTAAEAHAAFMGARNAA